MKGICISLKRKQISHMLPTLFCIVFTVVLMVAMWAITGKSELISVMTKAQRIACCGGLSALMGAMMCVLSNAANGVGTAPEERPNWYYPVLSGLLSLGAMCVAYTFIGMWPLGNETGMVVDMHHQYAPLLAGLRDNILTGDLSLYSFEVGLGSNYISLFGYYLASPLNILLVLFPKALLAEGILFITLIKNALCGAFFALCVQTVYRRKGLVIPMVSVMYSLMMYLLAYSWNIMWLDVVMVLPLAVLGFERLMKTGRFLPYVLALTYCLYANYYIGFMLCIFLVFYYVAFVLRQNLTGRELAVSFGRFAGYSVLGAALAAVMIIPVYLALQQTSAAGSDLPDLTNTLDIFQLLGRHLAGTSPTIRSGNLPNMYCGVLSALCVPLFAMNKGIPLRRRVAYMGVWFALLVTFVINLTDLAWHGLHSPNDLPYRFSFVYSFFVLLMAFEVLSHLHDITSKQVLGVLAGAIIYLVVEERFGDEAYAFNQIYINLALIAVYAAVLLAVANRKLVKRVGYALLLLIVTAEMTLNAGNALVQVNKKEYFTNHKDYVDNDTTKLLHTTVDRMQEIGDRVADGSFYRLEFLPRRTCVDTAMFQYRGITTFSSSNYYGSTKLMGGLGYAINGVNSHLYRSFVPFTDSLLGIKYVALENKLNNHAQLRFVETVSGQGKSYSIHENTDALSLGYMVTNAVKDYSFTKYNPFVSQNELFTAMTGIEEELYTLNAIKADNGNNAASGASHFQVRHNGSTASGSFSATVTTGGQIFVYVDCSAAESISVSNGTSSWSVSPHEPYIIDGGTVTAGTTFTMSLNSDLACSGNFYVATMNMDVYKRGMAMLKQAQLDVSSFSHTRIDGTVEAAQTGTMMTSIPYDAGWTVKVDGKKVDTYAVSEGFLAFAVQNGNHTVTMSYTPEGFALGLTLSILALLVLLALVFQDRWFPKAKALFSK